MRLGAGVKHAPQQRVQPFCSHAARAFAPWTTKAPDLRGFPKADDGTRTHDLLHGKRVVGSVVLRRNPFVHARLPLSVRFGSAAQMFPVSRRFVGVRATKA